MPKVDIYNLSGQVIGKEELDAQVFGVSVKSEVVHNAVVAQNANNRQVIAHTKTKAEVRGGGIKPWKQKGTGRARAGSIRSPLWKGGGVVFGPRKDRNYSIKINKKAKNKALFMVLSDKVKEGKLVLLEKLELTEAKTKKIKDIFTKLPCNNKRSLLSLAKKDDKIIKAAKNIAKVSLCAANSLNVVDLLKNEYFVLDKDAVQKIIAIYKK
jgi:large subunit ribosomal protein L4